METCPKYIIYGLKDPNTNEIRYIGKSSNGLKRPNHYFCQSALKLQKCHRSSWIKSLGGFKPHIVILEACSDTKVLIESEIKWIRTGKQLGWNLTNHTEGGEGTRNMTHTEEAKRKIGEASKRRWKTNPIVFTDEIRYKCGSSMRGKKGNKPWNVGIPATDDRKLKLSKTFSGEKNPAWKGGKPNCLDCGTKLSRRECIRCFNCSSKLSPSTETKLKISKKLSGELGPNWKGGKPKCVNCNKTLSTRSCIRCFKCYTLLRKESKNEVKEL